MGIEPQMEQNLRLGDVHNKIDEVIHSEDHLEICIFAICQTIIKQDFEESSRKIFLCHLSISTCSSLGLRDLADSVGESGRCISELYSFSSVHRWRLPMKVE
jgi:hypothetical protein